MSYVTKTLTNGEYILISTRPTLRILFAGCVFFSIVTVGFGLIIITPYFFLAWIFNFANEITVTNRRVVRKTGFIAYKTDEFLLRQVESVELRRTFFGSLLGWGSVIIHGSGGDPMIFKVSDPLPLRKAIDTAIEESSVKKYR